MNKLLLILFLVFSSNQTSASWNHVDLLLIGDSQTGATWAKSYLGNFLPTCLQGSFAMYGRGGTSPSHWLSQSNMDHIETILRRNDNHHQNIGPGERRIAHLLDLHTPKKVVFQFGGNMIGLSDAEISRQIDALVNVVKERECFFITPTYEMTVVDHRNVPTRNLAAVLRINRLITAAVNGRCQIINGVEIMKDSPYFDGKELLSRVQIPGLVGCAGAAGNDNVHVCGEAAKDWALRICDLLKQSY